MKYDVFDLLVIGGGITGAGVALDAAARGLKVALVEKRDFGSGTSSRSTKLIHGGLRYLEHLEFRLVREALRERATLARLAPHLCKPLEFLIPVYKRGSPSPLGTNRLKLRIGLWLYDRLAGRMNIGRHRWVTREGALRLAPKLKADGLTGGFIYYDCLTNDARLVIEVIKEAAARGAAVVNYAAVCGFVRKGGRISEVEVEDGLTRARFSIRAETVINATGVWSDRVSQLASHGSPVKLRPSKGIHIIVPKKKIDTQTAVLIPSAGESRFLFVVPWFGRIMIGTTDTDYTGDLEEPRAEEDEITRIVESAARSFPGSSLSNNDVISSFAGLRPLVSAQGRSTADVSRKELVYEGDSGLISIIGGKLTTYRSIAERAVDLVEASIGHRRASKGRKETSGTEAIVLAACDQLPDDVEAAIAESAHQFGLPAEIVRHLIDDYGGNYRHVLEITREVEELKIRLNKDLPYIAAEVVYSARYEMAVTVEDFLNRRTRIALLASDQGLSCATQVAKLLRSELGSASPEILTSNILQQR